MINNREAIPCDVLIVGVDEPSPETPAGIAYVETKSLDGETNLKIRQVGAFTSQLTVRMFVSPLKLHSFLWTCVHDTCSSALCYRREESV